MGLGGYADLEGFWSYAGSGAHVERVMWVGGGNKSIVA